jgi:outer membrane protein assembly factor BamB
VISSSLKHVHFARSTPLPRSLFILTAFLLLITLASAEDWPEFRGPTGQGIVRDAALPVEWSPARNVAWKRALPGQGWSSPIVHQGRIYLTSAVPVAGSKQNDLALTALCLEAKSGELLWQKEVFRQDGAKAPKIHAKNSHASPTPLTDGRHLYVHFGHQGTACLDLGGQIVWRNGDFKYDPEDGNGGSPILVDDRLIFSCDGNDQQFAVALDRASGKVLWKTARKPDSKFKYAYSTPLLITVNGQQQVISPGPGAVWAYDPANGKEIWRVRYGAGYSVVPRPVFGHGLVYICTGFDTPNLLAIRPDGAGDVTSTHVAWTGRRGVPLITSLLLVGDELYMVSDKGIASCLDARTGNVHWQERLGGAYSASPLVADGKVYFQSEEGTSVVVKAGKRFEQLARNSLEERTLASCAASAGALYIRTEKHLYRIQGR